MKKKSVTPQGALRSDLATKAKKRGESQYNLWLIVPPFDDEALVLSSDVSMELFYFLEGNRLLTSIDYSVQKSSRADGSNSSALARFAEVQFTDGSRSLVSFRAGVDIDGGDRARDHYWVTTEDLDHERQRIENWRRIIPCIRRIRGRPTGTIESQVKAFLRNDRDVTVGTLLQRLPSIDPALAIGCISSLLRLRQVHADTDDHPWSRHTRLWTPA